MKKIILAAALAATAITAQASQFDKPLSQIGFTKTGVSYENGTKNSVYTRSMDFKTCNSFIRGMSTSLGSVPRNVIENNEVRLVMWNADFGKLMLGCSTRTNKSVITVIEG